MLCVRIAHNLLLVSFVSRLATLEKTHPGTHALTLDDLFMYKARQADARGERLDSSHRATSGGALKAEAKARAGYGNALAGSANRSKQLLLRLCQQTSVAAMRYTVEQLSTHKALAFGSDCALHVISMTAAV